MVFRLWLIKLAHQRLSKIERHHLDTARRAASREVPMSDRSSIDLARAFMSRELSPSRAASDRELARKVRQVLAELTDNDREIVMLRNFEHLSNAEAGQVLGIQPEAAKKRYTRALVRMKESLSRADFGC
jgi:RNA polymerase sigma-70 factor (ECF subfamily)